MITATMIFVPLLIPIQFIERFLCFINVNAVTANMASTYIRIVSPSVIIFGWGNAHGMYAGLQGQPRISLFSTGIASIIHVFLANYLAVTLDMRMFGVAIATFIHFFCRFVLAVLYCRLHKDLKKGLIPINHEDSFKDLRYIVKIGWESFLLKVMGWWAFDIFTQLAA